MEVFKILKIILTTFYAIFDKKEQVVTYGHFHHMDEFEIKDMLGDVYE